MEMDHGICTVGEYVLLSERPAGWPWPYDRQCRGCVVKQSLLRSSPMASLCPDSSHNGVGSISSLPKSRDLHIRSSKKAKKEDFQYGDSRRNRDICDLFFLELHHP